MNWFHLSRLWRSWRRIRIKTKMVLGYILVVCIPAIIITGLQYNQLNASVLDQYAQNKQRFIDEAYVNMLTGLDRMDSIYETLQNNLALIRYLGGLFGTNAELIYSYNTSIDPTITFAKSSSPYVDELRIYKHNPDLISLYENTSEEAELRTLPQYKAILSIPLNKGLWVVERGENTTSPPHLYYYRNLYDEYYTNRIGVLRLTIKNSFLFDFANMTADVHNDANIIFLNSDNKPIYEMNHTSLQPAVLSEIITKVGANPTGRFFLPGHRLIVNSVELPELGLRAVILSPTDPVTSLVRRKQLLLIAAGFGSLLCLSFFYYTVASSIARRIVRLARYMKHVNEDDLQPYTNERHEDEIGSLVFSYNALIARINSLIHSVQEAQILQREAEIKMMQAQIKPHFIYNTLESMRMLARINKDKEVEGMAYSLGALMRYSLTTERDETTLAEEITNVEHYVAIQKIRMGDRLEFIIHRNESVSKLTCPKFILQPLVENCIVHGFSNYLGVGRIEISIDVFDAMVTIRIADNGNGLTNERMTYINQQLLKKSDASGIKQKRSIGLYNVNERIKAYFNEQSGIEMVSSPGKGTICMVRLVIGAKKEVLT